MAMTGLGSELFESPHSFDLMEKHSRRARPNEAGPRSLESHDIVVHGFTHREEMKTRGKTLIVNPERRAGGCTDRRQLPFSISTRDRSRSSS